MLAFVKRSFYQIDLQNATNPEAAELYAAPSLPVLTISRFANSKQQFATRVHDCVQASLGSVYVNEQDSSLQFSEWTEEYEPTRHAILTRVRKRNTHLFYRR